MAFSRVTPGFRRPKALTQRLRRFFNMSSGLPTRTSFSIMMGTKSFGRVAELDAVKARLQDADDGHGIVVQSKGLAEDGRIAGETSFPVGVVQTRCTDVRRECDRRPGVKTRPR